MSAQDRHDSTTETVLLTAWMGLVALLGLAVGIWLVRLLIGVVQVVGPALWHLWLGH